MHRDDTEPALWTQEGNERIKKLGLKMYIGDDDGKSKKRANSDEDVKPTKKAKQVKEFKISNTLQNLLWMTKTINKPGPPFLNQNSKTTQNWLKL